MRHKRNVNKKTDGCRLLNRSTARRYSMVTTVACLSVCCARSPLTQHLYVSIRRKFDVSQTYSAIRACRSTRVYRGDQVRKPKGSHGGHADVGEIPFEKSLERRRSHKWTRQPTPARLPLLPPRVLLIAYARIRNAGYALAHARFVSKSQIDR